MKKPKKQKAPQIIVRQSGRGVSRREAFDKANVGFSPELQKTWVEKVSLTLRDTKYFNYDKVFGKKKRKKKAV
jgi:hypothetical protein